ncbi:MAG: hypothetical protein Q9207_002442, partial [Kuettlingeria erythrocarpa]
QRQLASQALITHPYPLSFTILVLGLLSHYLPLYTFVTTAAGTIMALLLVVRWAASPYLALAERINYNWLEGAITLPVVGKGKNKNRKGHHSRSSSTSSNSSTTGGNVEPAPSSVVATNNKSPGRRSRNNSNSSRGGGAQEGKEVENLAVVTKWGEDEIIGALVMRVLRKEKRALIRAWTVKGRYRGHGVGRGLLEEAVRVAREMGCTTAAAAGGGSVGAVDFDWVGHASELICFAPPPPLVLLGGQFLVRLGC